VVIKNESPIPLFPFYNFKRLRVDPFIGKQKSQHTLAIDRQSGWL